MYLGADVQDTVVFLGFLDPSSPSGVAHIGTGFLLSSGGVGYVITARHVAEQLGGEPFSLRLNMPGAGSVTLATDDRNWVFHPDETVDVAALALDQRDRDAFRSRFLADELLLSNQRMQELDINVGCICYVVGLFRFLAGNDRNTPITYTGNVASLQLDEAVLAWNDRKNQREPTKVFLVECHGVRGISGAPVFVKQTRELTYPTSEGMQTVLVPSQNIELLGVYVGAWFLPPDDPLRETYKTRDGDTVPVGIGMVVPAQNIIELLELPELKAPRDAIAKANAARQTWVTTKL